MFKQGERYSREAIHEQLGVSLQSYLPRVGGRIVAACLRPDTNPEAPDIILVGTGPEIELSAEQLVNTRALIPIFLKRGTRLWEYVGDYIVQRTSTDSDDLKLQSSRSGAKISRA